MGQPWQVDPSQPAQSFLVPSQPSGELADAVQGRPADWRASAPEKADPAATAAWAPKVRVGRQAIYDRERLVCGYELFFGSHDADWVRDAAAQQATTQAIATTFGTFGIDGITGGKDLYVTVTRAFLTGMISLPLPAEHVVLEVLPHVTVDQELLWGLQDLREAGFRVAIDGFTGASERNSLLDVADFVKIDVNQVSSMMLPGLMHAAKTYGAQLLAEGIDSADALDRAHTLGFDLFQGAHLEQPEAVERRTLQPSQHSCARLLNSLGDPDAPITTQVRLIQQDPGLAMRLLRSANSATVAPLSEVTSLRMALVLLGPSIVRAWVMLTLLEGKAGGNHEADLWQVLARADLCEQITRGDPETAYIVGLLFGVSEMLGVPLIEIAESAGVGTEIRAALLEGQGPAGHALAVLRAYLDQDDEHIAELGYTAAHVSQLFLEAVARMRELLDQPAMA